MSSTEVCFNPAEHLMKIGKGDSAKDYLPVQYRLVWVNDVVDRAVAAGQDVKLDIDTEEIDCDLDKEFSAEIFAWNPEKRRSEKVLKTASGYAKYKATVTLQIGKMIKRASATKSERAVDFPDFIEKANTGAVGRALAMIGFGTQFAPDLDEAHRIVDAPVERSGQDEQPVQQQTPRQSPVSPTTANNTTPVRNTEQAPRPISDVSATPNRPSAPATQQNKALLDMISKAKIRAEQLGLDWEEEKAMVLGKTTPDPQLTVQEVAKINGDLTKAERKAS